MIIERAHDGDGLFIVVALYNAMYECTWVDETEASVNGSTHGDDWIFGVE